MDLISPGIGLILYQSVILLAVLLPILCLVSILKHQFNGNDKLVWVLVVIFVPILGPILYLTMGRKKRLEGK
ncbi:PLD nuclease N-terminal domain-containing protein [uncultured Roseivirga sp.]|uniref:PLD nuclease N-terminal domain-containing protein n=1 Tax=uncultured Roseivirga sp. TaxID=543088 RepID=UPI0030D6CFE6|tara:strand:- start:141004 stop:141219 length:216 start_codon:yes stop_codon:yes gene_type:complete